jgi:hypothetical protein
MRYAVASNFEDGRRYWNGVYSPGFGFGLISGQVPTTPNSNLATGLVDLGTARERADDLTELSRSAACMDARTWFVVEQPDQRA